MLYYSMFVLNFDTFSKHTFVGSNLYHYSSHLPVGSLSHEKQTSCQWFPTKLSKKLRVYSPGELKESDHGNLVLA